MDKVSLVHDFLETQIHMVIATSDKDNNPEAALVGFAAADDLSLVFGTYTTTRKFRNLQNNPRVAIVFGNKEKMLNEKARTSSISNKTIEGYIGSGSLVRTFVNRGHILNIIHPNDLYKIKTLLTTLLIK